MDRVPSIDASCWFLDLVFLSFDSDFSSSAKSLVPSYLPASDRSPARTVHHLMSSLTKKRSTILVLMSLWTSRRCLAFCDYAGELRYVAQLAALACPDLFRNQVAGTAHVVLGIHRVYIFFSLSSLLSLRLPARSVVIGVSPKFIWTYCTPLCGGSLRARIKPFSLTAVEFPTCRRLIVVGLTLS